MRQHQQWTMLRPAGPLKPSENASYRASIKMRLESLWSLARWLVLDVRSSAVDGCVRAYAGRERDGSCTICGDRCCGGIKV
eukprot:5135037-Amphidinium_carterae.3